MLLAQLPKQAEHLEAVKEAMPTEAMVQLQEEQKLKTLVGRTTRVLAEVLASAVATEEYTGTQIAVHF